MENNESFEEEFTNAVNALLNTAVITGTPLPTISHLINNSLFSLLDYSSVDESAEMASHCHKAWGA
jgi:hypothetical protein